jgi:hypothetical protein
MENEFEEIIKTKDKPLFKETISIEKHKIFYKYTTHKYYKYIYELLDTLCKKCPYENKSSIFHISLYFILKILYKCKNNPYLTNLDLIVLICFSLGIKANIKQKDFPSIKRIKRIYEEKYNDYKNEEICEGEIICLKLLNYNINILTAYECILLLTENDLKLKELSLKHLEFFMINHLRSFIYKSSFNVAKECIDSIKEKIIVKEPKIIKKKIITVNGVSCSPIITKYSSADRYISLMNSPQSPKERNTNQLKIKTTSDINNIIRTKKSCIISSNLNLKSSVDKIYYKKGCNDDIKQGSSSSLVTETNINKENIKKLAIYNKLNKVDENGNRNRNIYNKNKYYEKKKTAYLSKKKLYLKGNVTSNNTKQYDILKTNIYINSTHNCNKKQYYNNNSWKENDINYLNIYNQKNSMDNFTYHRNSQKNEYLQDCLFDSLIKETKYGIETKSINLESLMKFSNNNSNYKRYNMSQIKNDHKMIKSNNYFNGFNMSQENDDTKNNIGNYFIRW